MHLILQQLYPAHPRGIPPAPKSPRLEGTRGERVWGQHLGCGEAPWLRGQELESRKTEMPLISISFCILSSNASSPPAALGHGLAGRASLRAITTSGGEGGGEGSRTQPPVWTSHATTLCCTQGWHRDISCPQICPFGMGSSGASHPSSHPGLGAHLDPSPSRSVPDHPSPAPSATWQDQQPQGRGDPNRTVCQNPLPSSQPSKNSFRIAFEAPSPRKLPTALQAATSPSAAAFPVTQRETQQL